MVLVFDCAVFGCSLYIFISKSLSDRWADLYGECVIDCHVTSADGGTPENAMTCKLDFLKSASGYWSNGKRHEVQGTIINNKTGKYQLTALRSTLNQHSPT